MMEAEVAVMLGPQAEEHRQPLEAATRSLSASTRNEAPLIQLTLLTSKTVRE